MRDQFSIQSDQYARFRPHYPEALYQFLLSLVPDKGTAWDCGTGNGQAAARLARDFKQVEASDMSAAQIDKALPLPNVNYTVCLAESTHYPDHHFDLVTVAQALHWFDFGPFFKEVERVAKPGAVFAAWTYDLCEATPAIDALFREFYHVEIRPWFDDGRRHIDDRYQSIPFPFQPMETPEFFLEVDWDLAHLRGFLDSWSGVQHYIKAHEGKSPVPGLIEKAAKVWPGDGQTVRFRFPITLKAGRVGV